MFAPVAALRQRPPLQVGMQQRMAVVFVQARVLRSLQRPAHALGDPRQRFSMAAQRAAHVQVERGAPLARNIPPASATAASRVPRACRSRPPRRTPVHAAPAPVQPWSRHCMEQSPHANQGQGRSSSRGPRAASARRWPPASRKEGARGVVCADLNETDAKAVAAGVGGMGMRCDVGAGGRHERAGASRRWSRYGAVDIFCSNAGIIGRHGLDASLKEWRRTMDVNFMAHVLAARAVVPVMLKQGGGYIVATASAAGLLMQVDSATYTVSKHAAVAFAEWLSVNYAERGIKVSCLCPQGVRTPMLLGPSGNRKSFLSEGSVSAEDVAARVMEADRVGALPDPAAPGSGRLRAPQDRRPRPLAGRHAPPARRGHGRPQPAGRRLSPLCPASACGAPPARRCCPAGRPGIPRDLARLLELQLHRQLVAFLERRLMSMNIRCAPPGFSSNAPSAGTS